jgi:hypothetical protein
MPDFSTLLATAICLEVYRYANEHPHSIKMIKIQYPHENAHEHIAEFWYISERAHEMPKYGMVISSLACLPPWKFQAASWLLVSYAYLLSGLSPNPLK